MIRFNNEYDFTSKKDTDLDYSHLSKFNVVAFPQYQLVLLLLLLREWLSLLNLIVTCVLWR